MKYYILTALGMAFIIIPFVIRFKINVAGSVLIGIGIGIFSLAIQLLADKIDKRKG